MFNFDHTTERAENEGIWVEYQGSKFLIAHQNNIKFQREFARLQAPHAKKIMRGRLDPETALDIMCKSLAHGVLLDWKSVKNSKKEDVPYTKDNAASLLARNGEFRDFVHNTSLDYDEFKREVAEEMGND